MNYEYATSQKGYRFEDLNPENQRAITAMRWIEERLADFEYQSGTGIPSLRQIEEEIAAEVIAQVRQDVHLEILTMQISLIENQTLWATPVTGVETDSHGIPLLAETAASPAD